MDKLRYLLWIFPAAVVVLSVWLPVFLPVGVKVFLGHAVLSLVGMGAFALFLMNGYAQAMRS